MHRPAVQTGRLNEVNSVIVEGRKAEGGGNGREMSSRPRTESRSQTFSWFLTIVTTTGLWGANPSGSVSHSMGFLEKNSRECSYIFGVGFNKRFDPLRNLTATATRGNMVMAKKELLEEEEEEYVCKKLTGLPHANILSEIFC
jgi:hypothetical protein